MRKKLKSTKVICAFDNEEEAKKYCNKKTERYNYLKDKAILNNYGTFNHNDCKFNRLYEEFEYNFCKEHYNKECFDDLSLDEYKEFKDLTKYPCKKFHQWLINIKKIDKEIADATFEYIEEYSDDIDHAYSYEYSPIQMYY